VCCVSIRGVLASGDVASMEMCHLFFETEYVTLASTRPIIPREEFDASLIEKVIEELVTALTFHTLKDQLFVPLWRVFGPSFFSVW
jgi:hypothetical protein